MSRPRSKSSKKAKPRRRSRRKSTQGAVQFVRGLVMEGIGVAVLVFLYLTVQNTPANSVESIQANAAATQAVSEMETQNGKGTGHHASSWDDYRRQAMTNYGQPGVLGIAVWGNGSSR